MGSHRVAHVGSRGRECSVMGETALGRHTTGAMPVRWKMNRYAQTKAFLDAERKYMEPPEDPTDTQAFEEKMQEIWDDRLMDIHGWMIEGITERPDDDLKALARMVRDNANGTYTTAVGAYVCKWILDYCEPSEEEIIDELNREPDERD